MCILPRRLAALFFLLGGIACSQAQTPQFAPVGTLPTINVGGNYMEAQFARLDFAQKLLEEQREEAKKLAEQREKLAKSGTVSVLDLEAPPGAVHEFNTAANLLKNQKSKEAIVHLEKAIKRYPKFLSAHQNLGLAYENLDDNARARSEFEIAIKLDPTFATPFVHLGRLELSEENAAAAEADFEKAASLRPRDATILTLLCYAQYRTHQYRHVFDTAARVHSLDHKEMANVHYIAASSAIGLRDYPSVKRELELFVQEDPSNPLAPAARQNLEILADINTGEPTSAPSARTAAPEAIETFPNSEHLRSQLASLDEDSADDSCADCGSAPSDGGGASSSPSVPVEPTDSFRLRKSVDEVAVFFAVTSHGHNVTDLQANDLKILDASKPPEKLLQFTPQSKLPLHLGLLVDTSGSVKERFSFEKRAAAKFVEKVLSNATDLAFVAGFASSPNVTQDFTANHDELGTGIDKLENNGGTALFDAVSFACWKLAAYPERERVANVLVVLTDGEDNSSRTSLKQAIRDAETTGVTIYMISTQDHEGAKTDADKVLVELGERSGGEAMFPGDLLMLGHSFDKLRDIIRSRYLLAYKPADFAPDGTYRRISVVAERNGHRFQVHARRGYYARLSANSSPQPK